jgi:periplasmic protein TonB
LIRASTSTRLPPSAIAAAAGLHVLAGIAALDLWQRSLVFDAARPVEIEIVQQAVPAPREWIPEPIPEVVLPPPDPETSLPVFETAAIPAPEPPPPPPVFEGPKPPRAAARPVVRPAPSTPPPVGAAVPVPTSAPPAASPAAPRVDASYLARLAAAIERERDYPAQARRQRHQGRVVVHLVVAASGKLLAVHVAGGSGLETLDHAALGMVRRARLPPLAPGFGAESASFTIPIVFTMR